MDKEKHMRDVLLCIPTQYNTMHRDQLKGKIKGHCTRLLLQ